MAETPVTTLASIITLAHQQYGIRFQLSTQQLVDFANMIQFIAYNKDVDAFLEFEQTFTLGIDVFLQTDTGYVEPLNSDIGKVVSGSVSGAVGTLLNYSTLNRINKWIIAPTDGVTTVTLVAGESLTLVSGSIGTGDVVTGHDFKVSNGPYRTPTVALGNPAFRKFVGVTQVTDKQTFNVPPNGAANGPDDYGLLLNALPGRSQNFPYRYNIAKEEVTLVSATQPEIITTTILAGPSSTVLNSSKLRWIYYKNCEGITDVDDDAKLIIPERYRYEIITKGISLLADTATYGEAGTVRELIEPLCERFWEDMRYQYQQYGRGSDYISHGDTWDLSGLGRNALWGSDQGKSWW